MVVMGALLLGLERDLWVWKDVEGEMMGRYEQLPTNTAVNYCNGGYKETEGTKRRRWESTGPVKKRAKQERPN